MDNTNPELRAAIDVAKQRIKVDTYYPKAMNHGLKGNAQGFWSGTALGMATGAMAGGLIAGGLALFAPVAIPAYAIVLGLAGIGGTAGGMNGARIGASSAAIAGTTAELERRIRGDQLEQEILASPEKQREAIEAYRKNPVVEKDDTATEIFATTRDKGKAFHKIFSGKTMLATVAICAAASMVLFGGAFLLAGGTLLGTASTAIATGLGSIGVHSLVGALAIGAGAGAAMGISFGIAYPPLFASLTKCTGHLLSQNFMKGKQLPHIETVQEMEAEAKLNRDISENRIPPVRAAASESPSVNVSEVIASERLQAPQQNLAL